MFSIYSALKKKNQDKITTRVFFLLNNVSWHRICRAVSSLVDYEQTKVLETESHRIGMETNYRIHFTLHIYD